MKIAYLITAYSNYLHLERLINAIDRQDVTFYIHIDKKSEMPTNLYNYKNIVFIDRINVFWGGWSHQQAIIHLMKAAILSKYDYYILISGADYPIRPREFLYEKLGSEREYLEIYRGFMSHKPESRVMYYHFDCFDRREDSLKTLFYLAIEKILRKTIRKDKYPFPEIYHGSTWWALTHNCISYVLTFINEHPEYVKFFKTSWCAEETLIHTIIGNSEFLKVCKNTITYADWTTKPAPAFINEGHVQLFKRQTEFENDCGKYEPYFARKFNDGSKALIEVIDKELRK